MKFWSIVALSIVALSIVGCAPAPGGESLPPADVDSYATEVHDYVEARCATLDCHGDPGRPMRLFSETGLRMMGIERTSPIVAAELEANAQSLVGIDPGAPSADRHILILKPLAETEGGMEHVGHTVWPTRDEPGARCLSGWLEGLSDASWRATCASARDRWSVPPAE